MRCKLLSGLVALAFLAASSLCDASLIARYRFDGNANDSGPNGLDGIFSADPNRRPQLVADRFGNPNSAYLFDGKNDYIELPGSSFFIPYTSPGGVLRISAWVKVLAVNTDGHNQTRQPVVSLGKGSEWSYALYVYDSRRAGGSWWRKGGAGHAEIEGGPALNLGRWYELTTEYKYKSYVRVYVDGVLVTERTTFSGEPYGQTSFGPWIGARRDGQYLNAVIDDVRFYNSPIPEPSSWLAFAGIALAIGGYQLRRRTRASQTER